MEKELYHGSSNIIEKPEFGKGNPKNDYGLGFYCTEHIELAKEWACAGDKDGFSNRYHIDTENLDVCNLSSSRYHILNWLAVLLENRTFVLSQRIALETREYIMETFMPGYKDADIIIGYRADDSYFSFANAFLNNSISLEQLGKAMYLGRLGEQFVLKSRRAFDRLKFIDAEPAENEIYFPKRNYRDRKAREDFQKEKAAAGILDAVYAIDILRARWRNDDERLFRNR